MPEPPPLLTVVVPTRNEGGNVAGLVERLEAALPSAPLEVIFVDDSDDDTPARIEAMARDRRSGRIRLVARSGPDRQGGLSTAVVSGMRLARGAFVCVMDADLQHPPETVPRLLVAAQQGADLVVASRYVRGGSRSGLGGSGRRLVSVAATALARLLFVEARRSTDPLAGFFLCRRGLIDGIEFRPVGFKILLELLVCIPQGTVRDLPLEFALRQSGESKATLGQAVLYLRHLQSLFFSVQGAGRIWKFGLVGLSGLVVFLPLLALAAGPLALRPLLAFVPAWAASVLWNTILNRLFTFADQRRRASGEGPRTYLVRAMASGLAMFVAFGLLLAGGVPTVAAGALSALVAMLLNGVFNRGTVRTQSSLWSRVAVDGGVQTGLARLAAQVGAQRAYLLPASGTSGDALGLPAELVERVVRRQQPALWTEVPSARPQRRTNIENSSALLVPVLAGTAVLGVLVCERRARHGFDDAALETAIRAADGLAPTIAAAASPKSPRPRGAVLAEPPTS
ncbi:MAG: glycosyltransferase [Candidatus Dormibacteria bacterium]